MQRRTAALLLAVSLPLAFGVGSVSQAGELGLVAILGVGVLIGRSVSGFFRHVLLGSLAGAVAGTAVLGTGFRLAMRVVAIADPDRTPEFTVGGTAFIIIGVGLMLGAFTGLYLGGLRHLFGLGRAATALVATVAIMPVLFGDSELRAELFDLGFGAPVNIPMFASVAFAYGWCQHSLASRLERLTRRAVSDVVEPAPVQ